MKKNKAIASLSLDLDNLWSYLKIHGGDDWKGFPSYLDKFVPHVLEILDSHGLKITFFIVGQDAAIVGNRKALKSIADDGHEIANHSFNHESWLHLYSKKELEKEIQDTEANFKSFTDQKPVGFRGPGFSWSMELFEVLVENGYHYDASTLPTWIGPLARKYYFMTSNLTKEEKEVRKMLFGRFRDGFRGVKPYHWNVAGGKLLEIPVTTFPVFRVPFHLSYLIYLSNISKGLMRLYLKTALTNCKIANVNPSFLLHPLDIIGGDLVEELAFFPGMNVPTEKKVGIFNEIMSVLKQNFEIVNMSNHADYANNRLN